MPREPRKITLEQFGRRLSDRLIRPDCRVVWFLGAGCSVSSGIPGAADLVDQWLPRLKRFEDGDEGGWADWAESRFPGYSDNAASVYGDVIEALFPTERERQQEVERLTSAKEPAVGYALLACLMGHDDHGPRSNVVLTTNFDDLVADALYVLTWKKPLVVAHENLALFARASESRPLIVKLHGDARLAPRNTAAETAAVDETLRSRVVRLLQGCLLVFCGYGGNDESIAAMIKEADQDAFPLGIYWIGRTFPDGPVGMALRERSGVFHVEHRDFDTLMITLADELGVDLPDFDRWRTLFERYQEAVRKKAADAESAHEQQSATRLGSRLEAWRLAAEAESLRWRDPEAADEAFRRAVEIAGGDATVLGSYALFLHNVRGDMDRAEEFFRRALEADPDHVHNLGNYAVFLQSVRGDMDRAEEFYRRAVEADPDHAHNLGNYALFLQSVRGDADRAEKFYLRAVKADPGHAHNLGNYAVFLQSVRRDMDRAEELYRRAVEADPGHAINLGNYAQLAFARGRDDEAVALCDRALALPSNPASLRIEIAFYLYAHVPKRAAAALDEIRALIVEGVRSPGWDFSANLDRAAADGDARLPFLTALADVISEKAPIDTLDAVPEWAATAGDDGPGAVPG